MQRERIGQVLFHTFGDRGPKFLRDLASLLGGQFLSMLINFVSFTYLARVLDASSYGAVEYAIAVTTLFSLIVDCNLKPISVRYLSRDRARVTDLAANIPTARLLL